MRRVQVVAWLSLMFSTLCLPRSALAQPCPSDKEELLVLLHMEMAYEESSAAALLVQLQAGLSGLGLTVCTELGSSLAVPIARIRLSQTEGKVSSLHIEVRDTLTEKVVSRELDLFELPRDSHPFALALACDELLRASWLELAVRTPQASPPPASKALIADLRRPVPAPREPAHSAIGVAPALDAYFRGELHVGADLVATHWFVRALGVDMLVGLREGSAVQGQNGSARASLLGAALALRYRPLDGRRFALSVGARTQVWRATLRGRAEGDATDNEGTAWAVVENLTVLSTVYLHERWALAAEFGAGLTLREAVATEDNQKVAGVFGTQLVSSLRVATLF